VSPTFTTEPVPVLGQDLLRLLPGQGSFELQNDQPGKTHNWHHHSLDEELFIISGRALLFWSDSEHVYHEQECPAGTWISLPVGTRHGSVAGPDGAVYMIRPKDGRTAQTIFLEPDAFPHPTPTYERLSA
jgi:quercetin dioxygenase-like cupin family protein